MTLLIVGLLMFLGSHSVSMLASQWRERTRTRLRPGPWRGLSSLVAIAGFVLIIWGFGRARQADTLLYTPLTSLRYLTGAFTVVAFTLFVAAYVPRNHLKAALGHPMLASVVLWSAGHLLVTGTLGDAILFGSFLAWGVADLVVSRRRDKRLGTSYPSGTVAGDAICGMIGLAVWAVFAFWLHLRWIGVSPFS